MNGSNRDDILQCLLHCGSLDLSVLDDVEYDLCEIIEEMQFSGLPISLNAITHEVFRQGQRELEDAINDAIEEREQELFDMDDIGDTETSEYNEIQEEINELKTLNPEEDMAWYCNCLDTSCWFRNNRDIYINLLPREIEQIEYNMGFSLE